MSDAPVTTEALAANAAADALKAFSAISASDFAHAADVWIGGAQTAVAAMPMWRAATLNNAALGHVLRGDRRAASACLGQADAACRAGRPGGNMRSSSSGFHVRLASRNLASFEAASTRRARQVQETLHAHIRSHARFVAGNVAPSFTVTGLTAELCADDAACLAKLHAAVTLDEIRQCYAFKAARLEHALRHARHPQSLELIPFITGLMTPALLNAAAASSSNSETIDGL